MELKKYILMTFENINFSKLKGLKDINSITIYVLYCPTMEITILNLLNENIKNKIEIIAKSYTHCKKKCLAITSTGKQCTRNILTGQTCKIHSGKHVKLKKERIINSKVIVYHNHIPSDTDLINCPKCILLNKKSTNY